MSTERSNAFIIATYAGQRCDGSSLPGNCASRATNICWQDLNRVPVVGLTGLVDVDRQGGEAAAELRAMSRRHNWAIICPAALEKDSFTVGAELSALMGDERVPYEADRVLLVRQQGEKKACGCGELIVHTLKDRTGPTRTWHLGFFRESFLLRRARKWTCTINLI